MRIFPKCPTCGGKAEWFHTRKQDPRRIYCKRCERFWKSPEVPSVLVLDIETSQINFKGFQTGKQVVRSDQVVNDWFVLCWSAKYLFHRDVFGDCVTPAEAKKRNDRRVTASMNKLLQGANFVIHYNGSKFDIPKMNWRFMVHKQKPLPPLGEIDVMAQIKKVARPTSAALDFIAVQLGYDGKLDTSRELWNRCEAGEAEALDYMFTYNQNDIWKTEDIYIHARPYMKTHPNFGAFFEYYQTIEDKKDREDYRCPRCIEGVIHKTRFSHKIQTPAGFIYKVAMCPNCNAWVRLTVRDGGQIMKVK